MPAVIRLSTLALCALLIGAQPALAQNAATSNNATAQVAPPHAAGLPATNDNSATNNDKDKNVRYGCSRADWLAHKCTTHPSTIPPNTAPYHRRPIIIVPQPAAPPIDDTPLASDWEGCRQTKLNQLRQARSGNLERANQLDEWLWKNCRSYSEDLRQLEQDQM
jgi:hypothetical protein